METKTFVNGFTSWIETHYEIVSFIERELRKNFPSGIIGDTQKSAGIGGIYKLAEEWTNEFEEMNSGREWDGEYFDAIEEFMSNKNKNIQP